MQLYNVRSDWHPSKWCDGTQRLRLTRSHRLLASLPAAAESREVKRTRGHVIAMLYSHVFLHGISLLKLHISISSLPGLFTSSSLYYICFLLFSLYLLPLCTITSASPLVCSQSVLTFLFFLSRGLRPAVPVLFEPFQVLSQQQGEIVMVLAEFVNINSWRMRITQQWVRICWRLRLYHQ